MRSIDLYGGIMKATFLIAFTCVMIGVTCRADSLNAQTEQEITRELCNLELASKQISKSKQETFFRSCLAELKIARSLGEFYYDPNFYPEGFGELNAPVTNASISDQ